MKKVRFETPTKLVMDTMQDYECHSPRPFIERQFVKMSCDVNQPKPVVFTDDPVERFVNGDSSPYPLANKTYLNAFAKLQDRKSPSSDLDLSMLDSSQCCKSPLPITNPVFRTAGKTTITPIISVNNAEQSQTQRRVLTSIENETKLHPPNTLLRDSDFFLRRDNLGKLSLSPLHQQLKHSSSKENNPLIKKKELITKGTINTLPATEHHLDTRFKFNGDCTCHHCINIIGDINTYRSVQTSHGYAPKAKLISQPILRCCNTANVTIPYNCSCNCNMPVQSACQCSVQQSPPIPQNAVDKKTWAIEKYEKMQKGESFDVEKPIAFKEKREPTVADLFKIIKLQNEQLQLLQEKVDKFIASQSHEKQNMPIENYVTEQMAVQTVNAGQHKISIGVMTSFEMVRTSTVINKEIVKQSEAQIQCNRSQISIKEIVAKKQTGNLNNFLDGIPPVTKNLEMEQMKEYDVQTDSQLNDFNGHRSPNVVEDKTLNEFSLYNVQVDNATTPMMSPDQSLYLDIRDYSESDSGSEDQSNVGWTYYNKVMTHVNDMLQDSDMPSSASALYRHTKQKCLQMQIDKSSASVGKRVTFGDDPLGLQKQQQHIATPTDTSLKMNQLAAKYLKNVSDTRTSSPRASTEEMSFATKNYMERHKLLQGQKTAHNIPPVQSDIPRFLDITTLKQQPKLI